MNHNRPKNANATQAPEALTTMGNQSRGEHMTSTRRPPRTRDHRRTRPRKVTACVKLNRQPRIQPATPMKALDRPAMSAATPACPSQPATLAFDIQWDDVLRHADATVSRYLRARRVLPHGWDGRRLGSHIALTAAGTLLRQTREKPVTARAAVAQAAHDLFRGFPALRRADNAWAAEKCRALRRRRHSQGRG
jgi:hypothetical protein